MPTWPVVLSEMTPSFSLEAVMSQVIMARGMPSTEEVMAALAETFFQVMAMATGNTALQHHKQTAQHRHQQGFKISARSV